MRGKKTFVRLAAACAVALMALPTFAVTDQEMDKAKAITAKEYLRWVNDGSGYLDEFEVNSSAELAAKLKAKEKENIQKFNSVTLPTDYASWDKDKLLEYWTVTFFKSPLLDAKGKGALPRIKKKLQAMTVSAAAPAPQAAAPEPEAQPSSEVADQPSVEIPTAQEVAEQQDILADQKALENDARMAEESRHEEKSNTWVYVLVLAILVAVVIWLVVYAANLMKRQPTGEVAVSNTDADKEIKRLRERLQAEESRSADLGMEIERLKLENSRLQQQVQKLREQPAAVTSPVKQRTESTEKAPADSNVIKVIYLGRANRRGIFVRADRRLNPGNTVYRLDTNDGLVGTFHVVDRPEVVETILTNAVEYLDAGCTGEDLEDTAGVTKIVTESPGTAIFENGYWKVLRKSRIRFE